MEWSERIGRRIRLRDLHILLAVVQCGSMAKAAEQLAISRPVISRAINDLEHALGVRLLERDRHGAQPTIYGVALLKRGTSVFDELRQGVKDIEFLADPTAGEVRIGCHPFLAPTFVTTVISRLSRRYPRIVFHLAATQVEVLHRELSERKFDLLVAQRFGPLTSPDLAFESLYDDVHVVVAGVQSQWARRRMIKLAQLVSESWVLPPPDSVLGSIVMKAFRASGLDYPHATVFTAPAEVRIGLVTAGHFLTMFPASILRFSTPRPALKVLPVDLRVLRMPVGIITLKDRTLSPTAGLFVKHAHEVAKQIGKQT